MDWQITKVRFSENGRLQAREQAGDGSVVTFAMRLERFHQKKISEIKNPANLQVTARPRKYFDGKESRKADKEMSETS